MSEALFHSRLEDYLDSLVPVRSEVMQEMEAYAREVHFPIIGPAAGYFNYMIARMIGARQVFELGSGYGYSTAWFARAVRENGGGVVHHVVWDEELSNKARGYLTRLGYADLVSFHVGEAVETLQTTTGVFDLMFNDIDKAGYPASIPVIKEKLKEGGALLLDNTLWHGAIFDEADRSANTIGVLEVTRMLTQDPDFVTSIAPIRDGVLVAFRAGARR
ncbi:MAG TPA: O-methyltransferase [Chthonomonadales bacterium]|nr:O-methyltransferase [Chthonomonadales bacterium]